MEVAHTAGEQTFFDAGGPSEHVALFPPCRLQATTPTGSRGVGFAPMGSRRRSEFWSLSPLTMADSSGGLGEQMSANFPRSQIVNSQGKTFRALAIQGGVSADRQATVLSPGWSCETRTYRHPLRALTSLLDLTRRRVLTPSFTGQNGPSRAQVHCSGTTTAASRSLSSWLTTRPG